MPRAGRPAGPTGAATAGARGGGAAGSRALVGPRSLLARPQPAPRRAAPLAPGDGAGRRARGGRRGREPGYPLPAAAAAVRLAGRDEPHRRRAARRGGHRDRGTTPRPALAGAAESGDLGPARAPAPWPDLDRSRPRDD